MIQAGYVRSTEPRVSRVAPQDSNGPVHEPEVLYRDGGGYGVARRPRWEAMGAILAIHLVLFAALAVFDVIHVGKKKHMPRLTVMEIQPEKIVTPPPAAPKPTPQKPIEQPIVAPPPIIQVAAPAPPVATVPVPPPPAPPVASAPAAPSATVSEVAAPISAPDGTAKTLGNPSPKYPMDARRNHWEGTVRLRVVITPEGQVKEIAVARSSGFDSLDKSALDTVRKWRFVPGKQSGVAVEAVGFLSIPFRLS